MSPNFALIGQPIFGNSLRVKDGNQNFAAKLLVNQSEPSKPDCRTPMEPLKTGIPGNLR
jgi:hypothetical protein